MAYQRTDFGYGDDAYKMAQRLRQNSRNLLGGDAISNTPQAWYQATQGAPLNAPPPLAQPRRDHMAGAAQYGNRPVQPMQQPQQQPMPQPVQASPVQRMNPMGMPMQQPGQMPIGAQASPVMPQMSMANGWGQAPMKRKSTTPFLDALRSGGIPMTVGGRF